MVYCWIHSHIGIACNESVDQKAKDSLNLHPTNFPLPIQILDLLSIGTL